MQKSSGYFKDEIIQGISLSLKHLQTLQAEATKLRVDGFGITKRNPHFQNLASYLDLCFSFGLSNPGRGYWEFVKHFVPGGTRDLVETHRAATNASQKGHLWLFLSILENTLGSFLELFTANKRRLASSYRKFALLRDVECCEVLKTLVRGLDALEFSLDIDDPYLGYENEAIRPPLKEDPSWLPPSWFKEGIHLSRGNGEVKSSPYDDDESDDGQVAVHLKSRHRKSRRKTEKANLDVISTEEDAVSSVESIGLEDDPYIPEIESDTPVSVSFLLSQDIQQSLSNQTFVKDESIYEKFLLAYNAESRASTPEPGTDQGTSSSAPLTTSESGIGNGNDQEDLASPSSKESNPTCEEETCSGGRREAYGDEGIVLRDGAYKITYVSDEGEKEEEGEGQHVITERTHSIDSFDEFCRTRPSNKEGEATEGLWPGDDEGAVDSEQEYERAQLEDSLRLHDEDDGCALEEQQLSKDQTVELMALSPHNLPETSIRRVMQARTDTSIGILLPTLPRRPSAKEAVKMGRDFSADQKTILTLSLETFLEDGEQFRKLFQCFLGSLHGIHTEVSVVLSDLRVYILRRSGTDSSTFFTVLSFAFDSINKIQTGLNFQDVIIHLDEGLGHIWTCDEVITRSLISSLKSGILCGRSKSAEEEPLGQDSHSTLTVALREFLSFIEGLEDFEIFYFGVVQFWPLMDENSEHKVLKGGYLCRRQHYLGVVATWERSFFSLRGHLLYEYTGKEGDQVKQVLNLRDKCGGCVRIKDKDRPHVFRIFGKDGVHSIADLAADSEEEANDWIMSVCMVMAQVRTGGKQPVEAGNESVVPCGLALTGTGIYTFQIQRQTGKLQLLAMASLADITRVCVDNQQRDFCALLIDSEDDHQQNQKSTWIVRFQSEVELGKFEQHVFACWHSIYQIPLQFVLLADGPLKETIRRIVDAVDCDQSISPLAALRL